MIAAITAIAAILQFVLFAIWNKNDWINLIMKNVFLLMGLALSLVALKEFGFIVSI